ALTLRNAGYTVLEAANGGEALALATKNPFTIHLVLTDVIMPVLTGPQVATLLLDQDPKLRVLYMSGYTDSLLAPHREQDIRSALLQKPFTPDELLRAVRRVLRRT